MTEAVYCVILINFSFVDGDGNDREASGSPAFLATDEKSPLSTGQKTGKRPVGHYRSVEAIVLHFSHDIWVYFVVIWINPTTTYAFLGGFVLRKLCSFFFCIVSCVDLNLDNIILCRFFSLQEL